MVRVTVEFAGRVKIRVSFTNWAIYNCLGIRVKEKRPQIVALNWVVSPERLISYITLTVNAMTTILLLNSKGKRKKI